jgi:hypothetical protein
MRTPKIIKLVHIPLVLQERLEAIKGEYGVSHTAIIARGIELASAEIERVSSYKEVRKLYSAADAKRVEAVV